MIISNERIEDYIVIQEHHSDFNDKVAMLLNEGWVIYGHPIVQGPYIYQAFATYAGD